VAVNDENGHRWTLGAYIESQRDIREADQRLTDQRFLAAGKAVDVALTDAKAAVQKAEDAQERRLEGMNEFRKTLTDQASTFVTRPDLDSTRALIGVQIAAQGTAANLLEKRVAGIEGRSTGLNQGLGYLIGVLGIAVAIIEFVVLHK
jgi:hypothetical protein